MARLLGPADTGLYNVVATTLLVGFTLGTLGINVGASYFVSAGRWHAGDAFRQLQLAALGAGLAAAAAGLLVALAGRDSLFEGVPTEDLLIVLGALPFMLSWTFTSAVALALGRYETYALAPLATNAVALALSCVLSPLVGLTGAVVALAAAQVVGAAALLVWGLRTLPPARSRVGSGARAGSWAGSCALAHRATHPRRYSSSATEPTFSSSTRSRRAPWWAATRSRSR